jgi:hypothetical protein
MDIAGLTAGYQSQRSKSAKSLYKPYWNDLLQTMWDSASEKEKLWLKCDENTNLKRQLKQEYCNACDVFDKHLRSKLEKSEFPTNVRIPFCLKFWEKMVIL